MALRIKSGLVFPPYNGNVDLELYAMQFCFVGFFFIFMFYLYLMINK